ncbi:MAG: hypothetical protein WBZ20_10710 [Nitrososphaeraceae archaeon]
MTDTRNTNSDLQYAEFVNKDEKLVHDFVPLMEEIVMFIVLRVMHTFVYHVARP